MAKSVMILGMGRFGASVAHTLFQMGYDVLGIDTDEKVVQENVGKITFSVQGDATNEATLRELGASNFDAAVVAIGTNMQASLMTSVLLANLDVPLIVARAQDQLQGNTLQRIGVHRVIYPEQEMGEFLAHSLLNPDVLEYMDLTPDYGISKMTIPDYLEEHSISQAGFTDDWKKPGLKVIAIKRGREITLLPDENNDLHKGDVLAVAGKDEDLEKFHTDHYPQSTNSELIAIGIHGLVDVTVIKGTNRELIRIRVSENSPYIGKNIQEISLPPDTIISCILRIDGRMLVPYEESTLEALDQIVIITRPDDKQLLQDAFLDLEKQ
jgi:trk system potassium uptake protein TrkA